MAAMLTYMKGLRPKNRVGGAFGSYGWSGEGPKIIHEWLASMDMEMPALFVKTQWSPGHESFGQCHALGKAVGQALVVKCGG
jgi:flavorubredoxin